MRLQLEDENVVEALWYTAPGVAEIRSEALPDPQPDDLAIRALFGAVSRGTERLVFEGRVPETEWERMRAPFQMGSFPHPVKYGYATVGEVEAGPDEWLGRIVFVLHPHQTLFRVPQDAVVSLPQALPPARAVLAANMETALNAVWDSGAGPADRIAIVGSGVVGMLTAALLSGFPGANVTVIDKNPDRAAKVEAFGLSFCALEEVSKLSGACDTVFHASGNPAGLALSLELCGFEGTVMEMSWYGAGDVPVPLGGAFHTNRLTLKSTQVGHVAANRRARWSHKRRLGAALGLLLDPRFDALLDEPVAFHDLPSRLPAILDGAGSALCPLIAYPDRGA